MRKKTKFVFTDPDPGTTRLRRVFAWRWEEIDGELVWLEYYEVLEAFILFEYTIKVDSVVKKAQVTEWKAISKRLIK